MVKIPDSVLSLAIVALLLLDCIILSVWASVSPFSIKSNLEKICQSDQAGIFMGILIGWKMIGLLYLCYLCYRIFHIPSEVSCR